MTSSAYAAQANGMAGATRVRAFRPCPATSALALWSPISIGVLTHKHDGRPWRTEVSHP